LTVPRTPGSLTLMSVVFALPGLLLLLLVLLLVLIGRPGDRGALPQRIDLPG